MGLGCGPATTQFTHSRVRHKQPEGDQHDGRRDGGPLWVRHGLSPCGTQLLPIRPSKGHTSRSARRRTAGRMGPKQHSERVAPSGFSNVAALRLRYTPALLAVPRVGKRCPHPCPRTVALTPYTVSRVLRVPPPPCRRACHTRSHLPRWRCHVPAAPRRSPGPPRGRRAAAGAWPRRTTAPGRRPYRRTWGEERHVAGGGRQALVGEERCERGAPPVSRRPSFRRIRLSRPHGMYRHVRAICSKKHSQQGASHRLCGTRVASCTGPRESPAGTAAPTCPTPQS